MACCAPWCKLASKLASKNHTSGAADSCQHFTKLGHPPAVIKWFTVGRLKGAISTADFQCMGSPRPPPPRFPNPRHLAFITQNTLCGCRLHWSSWAEFGSLSSTHGRPVAHGYDLRQNQTACVLMVPTPPGCGIGPLGQHNTHRHA